MQMLLTATFAYAIMNPTAESRKNRAVGALLRYTERTAAKEGTP